MKFSKPKGTRDFAPGQLEVREALVALIENKLKIYGFYRWDGPIFENIETLTIKSGNAIKEEIYTFEDKAHRELGLRFDLTTTLARIVAQNNSFSKPLKGYNLGKVFRYENTQAGRYREFLQMDADVFGSESKLVEVELLLLANNVMSELDIGVHHFNINDRKIISGYLSAFGVVAEMQSEVCRILDKKGKITDADMKMELEKIGIVNAGNIIEFIKFDGNNKSKLNKMREFLAKSGIDTSAVDSLESIIDNLVAITNSTIDIRVDFSLMRGLDYYTDTIYETVLDNELGIGVIGGGGRYDKLVGIFGCEAPACGISFGIERMIDIIESRIDKKNALIKSRKYIYLACDLADSLEAIKISERLRKNGFECDFDICGRNIKKQISFAYDSGYAWLIVLENGTCKIKNLVSREETSVKYEDIEKIIAK